MAGETNPAETGMDRAMYDEFYSKLFAEGIPNLEQYIPGDLATLRSEDINDSFGRYRRTVDLFFPDAEEATKSKILAICSFFERMGYESGVVNQGEQQRRRDEGPDSDASFRRRVTEGFGW